MNYKAEIKKFITSQYVYSGTRIALATVIPSVILAYLGLLKDYFLFPIATSFVGLTDMAGPYIRRRNSLILAIVCFTLVTITASFLKDYPILIFLEIIVFGMFFTMIGIYGIRLATVGGLSLVVFSIFIDGHLSGEHIWESVGVFIAGAVWFFIVFIVVTKLQPYKLPGQMIGENYLQLAEYLKLKAKFYRKNPDIDSLYKQIISKQVVIKNLQEETREVVFKTRTIVNESTTTSRLLMLMFLDSIDLYEKLFTSDQNYAKVHKRFDSSDILLKIHDFLNLLADEITNIGIALQSGNRSEPSSDINASLDSIYQDYLVLRNEKMNPETLEDFMSLRLILLRVNAVSDNVKSIYRIFSQDLKNAKSLSTGLDFEKFVPKQEKLNLKVLLNNFSLKSGMFKHSIRLTLALLLGYGISKFEFLGIGHSYWILITIIAIIRPSYSTTKHRNILRIYGTISGAVLAYLILIFIDNDKILLGILLTSMIMCFTFLKEKYDWAVFFMTIYIFIIFNFLSPGNVNLLFKDRILDTAIAAVITFGVSYFVFPVWEHSQNIILMKKSADANLIYFKKVIEKLRYKYPTDEQYRVIRKDAIINLANLSDNFQRMLSDPKNQQNKMEIVHQYVNTTHLITAYTASLSQYTESKNDFSEIDLIKWGNKISNELEQILLMLNTKDPLSSKTELEEEDTKDLVAELIEQRKSEINDLKPIKIEQMGKIHKLTELKNIREILNLIYDVCREQKRIVEHYIQLK